MGEVKWIKLATQVFDNRKIKQIERMPDGDSIIVVWFKLLCLAGTANRNGMIFLTEEIPYTEEMLITEFNMEQRASTLRLALRTFEQFGMIEIIDNIFYISSWEKYQNVEGLEKIREQTRKRVAKHRSNQKLLECNVTCNDDVTDGNATDIEIDKDKEIDKDIKKEIKEKKKLAKAQTSYFENEELNNTFLDFIKMRKSIKNGAMTERAISMMINKLKKYDEQTAIAMLNQSILNNWKDIYEFKDQTHKAQQTKKPNQFNNFPQRNYSEGEMLSMEQRLLNR